MSKNLCLLKIDLKCCIFLNGLGSHDIVQLHIKSMLVIHSKGSAKEKKTRK